MENGLPKSDKLLAGLTALQTLNLSNNQISDISALDDLTALHTLDLSNNSITYISALTDLTALETLDLSNNHISNIGALAGLTGLQTLDLSNNAVNNLSVLEYLANLQTLDLHDNDYLDDISPLASLTNLTSVNVASYWLSNVSALVQSAENGSFANGGTVTLFDRFSWDDLCNDYIALVDVYGVTVDPPASNCYSTFQSIVIGDVDGFGWTGLSDKVSANRGVDPLNLPSTPDILDDITQLDFLPADLNGDGVLGDGEFLPAQADEYGGRILSNWTKRSTEELADTLVTGEGSFYAPYSGRAGAAFTDVVLSGTSTSSGLPGVDSNQAIVFDFYIPAAQLQEGTDLYLNMLISEYQSDRVRLTFEEGGGFTEVGLQKQPAIGCGRILRASVPFTGEPVHCSPYDPGETLTFSDIFTDEGDFWHGYLKVAFVDAPRTGKYEPYVAIDFIEISTDQESIGGPEVETSGYFERVIIGDVDGFGWGDGQDLANAGISSSNDDLVSVLSTGSDLKLPVNLDGTGLVGPGDFLPDMNGDGGVHWCCDEYDSNNPEEYACDDCGDGDCLPGDDWDNRIGESAGTHFTGKGYSEEPQNGSSGSQFTDITLSSSYDTSASYLADFPDNVFPESHDLGDFPVADEISRVCATDGAIYCGTGDNYLCTNQPGNTDDWSDSSAVWNDPFVFDFYVDKYALDLTSDLYFTIVFGDFDVGEMQIYFKADGEVCYTPLTQQLSTEDGLVQIAYVPITEDTEISLGDVFKWDSAEEKWHGELTVRFRESGTGIEPYTAFDFVELSTNLNTIGVLRVPEDYDTIQSAINGAWNDNSHIYVAEGTYSENLKFNGKNIVLRSMDPMNSDCRENTVLDGGANGSVITFGGGEDSTCMVTGFTIRNGDATIGGGVQGNGCSAQIRSNIISENTASSSGGGIANCLGIVRQNDILNNTATNGSGGGIFGCRTVYQNRINRNNSGSAGGGVYTDLGTNDSLVLVNNEICGNSTTAASTGCGAHVVGTGDIYVAHNVFADNTGGQYNLFRSTTTTGTVVNGIFWDYGDDWTHLSTIADHCCIQGADGTNDNIGGNPCLYLPCRYHYVPLANPRAPTMGSPCIGSGANSRVTVDIDGRKRTADSVDIGAYQYIDNDQSYDLISAPEIFLNISPSSYTSGAEVELIATGALYYNATWKKIVSCSSTATLGTGITYVIPEIGPQHNGAYECKWQIDSDPDRCYYGRLYLYVED